MTSADIRDHYDIKDPYDGDIAYDILTLQPPTSCRGTTGIDSLTTVIRRLYAHAMIGGNGISQTRWFQDAEKENHILLYAWAFIGDSKEGTAIAQLVRAQTIQKMGGRAGIDDPSFKELCTSEMMNKTFWSQRDFCLYYPVYSWRINDILEQSPSVKATESIVMMDQIESPTITLQKAVEYKFGDFRNEDSGNLHYRPSQPLVVRVLLRTNGDINDDPDNRLSFRELQRFQMPQEKPRKDDAGWILVEGERLNYTIAAVVKMREVEAKYHADVNQNEVETENKIRTYSPNRNEIIPEYGDQHLMSSRWSVEDQRPYPMEYMLFYIPSKAEETESLEGPAEVGWAPKLTLKVWGPVQGWLEEEQADSDAAKAKNESQPGPTQNGATEASATTTSVLPFRQRE